MSQRSANRKASKFIAWKKKRREKRIYMCSDPYSNPRYHHLRDPN